MIYEDFKVYGPYLRKDGRMHVCLKSKEGTRKTVSYPKYLMEMHLERYLGLNETVDHIDRDFTNNSIGNLQILAREDHSRLDAKRSKDIQLNCEHCGNKFILSGGEAIRDSVQNRKRGKRGPFCSRSCAGKASHNIENYKIKNIEIEHFYIDKCASGGIGDTLRI
jgi:hypothetical protein